MRPKQPLLAAVLLGLAANASAAGEIYRCSAAGSVTYQEIPCPAAADAATMPIRADFPAVNQLERDRLLQREAALDARLEARRDRESREAIASSARQAQVQVAQAQADAAAPVYFVSRPRWTGPRSLRPAHRPRNS